MGCVNEIDCWAGVCPLRAESFLVGAEGIEPPTLAL